MFSEIDTEKYRCGKIANANLVQMEFQCIDGRNDLA